MRTIIVRIGEKFKIFLCGFCLARMLESPNRNSINFRLDNQSILFGQFEVFNPNEKEFKIYSLKYDLFH